MYRIVIADDHTMVGTSIQKMLESSDGKYKVLFIAPNGKELLNRFNDKRQIPDLILLDISMPIMDGFATMKKLNELHPELLVICLTMNDNNDSFLKMIEAGAHGFISKTASESELKNAIDQVCTKGSYYTPAMAEVLFKSARTGYKPEKNKFQLTKRETELLGLACSELTYAAIADKMCLSPKTVDGYRGTLFEKLNVKSRVGLVLFAIKHGLYKVEIKEGK